VFASTEEQINVAPSSIFIRLLSSSVFHLHQSSIFISLPSSSIFIFPFTSSQNQHPSLGFCRVYLLFFSILSSMSFLDSGLAMDLGSANPTKQTSQEYGDHWMSEWAHNMQVMPLSQAISRDSRTGRNQTASLFAGLLEFAARRGIVFESRREGLVKVDGKVPILLRLELAKYSKNTPYSTAWLMRFGGQHTDPSNVFSITDNEQEDRHSPAGDSKVMSVKPTAPTTETPGGPLSANPEEAESFQLRRLRYGIPHYQGTKEVFPSSRSTSSHSQEARVRG
jgi:hypothetical protein